jgi:hypothetical protein
MATYKAYLLIQYKTPINTMVKIGEKIPAKGDVIYLRYAYKEIKERLSFLKNEYVSRKGFHISKEESNMHKNYFTCYGEGSLITRFVDSKEVSYYMNGYKMLFCIVGINKPYDSIKDILI